MLGVGRWGWSPLLPAGHSHAAELLISVVVKPAWYLPVFYPPPSSHVFTHRWEPIPPPPCTHWLPLALGASAMPTAPTAEALEQRRGGSHPRSSTAFLGDCEKAS